MQHISRSQLFSKTLTQNIRSFVSGNLITSDYVFRDQYGNSHSSRDIFDNKKVVVFGIPGDNPTDTFHHIPSFVKSSGKIYGKADSIICLQNSDVPILRAKSMSLDPKRTIGFLQDPASKFAEDNALCENENLNQGTDSPVPEYKRFALIVDNGRIVFESVEKNVDEWNHTDAETILKKL
ncbi:hypothetical protein DICPUDRAFT_150406 [Dictyostelium purpureum]|uniref:Redoxin domain-containing protein n=1 Tax=Dictyostelium purpureum TaxID=5786 RepID=F0ZG92_DICPU|nr:uncharacterized protein DICPUDRAFT_150406 [Dictyostelium purpureum]EGC37017.1 hypothetical protein DICPUDRAFT_150406 [Dictyostelium purpureum]|eukprot:XP_003286445.1 hypothetical protein DICPUDRAFT_150406 [Dictyostelium purpureum]